MSDLFNVMLVGDSVGKTTLLTRFTDKTWPNDAELPTLGASVKTVTINENQEDFDLDIWDTPRRTRERDDIVYHLYQEASVIILAFDLTNKESFTNLNNYLTEIKNNALPDTKVILIGTKADDQENRKVSQTEIDEFQRNCNNSSVSHKIEQYIETSAKTGLNVDYVFQTATKLSVASPNIKNPNDPKLSYSQKKDLTNKLSAYIERIEKNKSTDGTPNFSHGFWFFKNSRAKNREANYLLAKKLKAKLENNESLGNDLGKITTLRSNLASNASQQGLFSKQNPNRGINSSELNNVIKEAKSYLKLKK